MAFRKSSGFPKIKRVFGNSNGFLEDEGEKYIHRASLSLRVRAETHTGHFSH